MCTSFVNALSNLNIVKNNIIVYAEEAWLSNNIWSKSDIRAVSRFPWGNYNPTKTFIASMPWAKKQSIPIMQLIWDQTFRSQICADGVKWASQGQVPNGFCPAFYQDLTTLCRAYVGPSFKWIYAEGSPLACRNLITGPISGFFTSINGGSHVSSITI